MKEIFQEQKWFYIPYIILILVCSYFIISYSKAEIHLWTNQFYSGFFDVFFRYVTELGNGALLPIFLLIVVLIRYRYGLYMLSVFLGSGIVVQLLKRLVFFDMARPLGTFGETTPYHWVEGVERLCCNSFPSGHSATAFGFFLCFAVVFKEKWIKIAMFFIACLVAYSRVYLSQHYLMDIMAGSFIGVTTATLLYPWIMSMRYPWLDKNIKTIIPREAK